MNIKKLGMLTACAAALTGCGSSGAPKCSDSDATDTVVQIVTSKSGGAAKGPLSNIRTIDKNETTGAYQCAAKIHVVMNGGFAFDKDITYKTERTDDGKPYITVFGI